MAAIVPDSPQDATIVCGMPCILIVDDDCALTELLVECLAAETFDVQVAHSAEEALQKLAVGIYSLVVLDVMLPRMSGFEALLKIRERSDVPVLMLTARGDPVDRVNGLQMGADDYLGKPFNERELVARIQAILRRARPAPSPATREGGVTIQDVALDLRSRKVRAAGKLLDLTTVEFDVLQILMSAAGTSVSREELVERALGRAFSVFDRSIDNHLSALRRKLGPDAEGADRIKTVRGIGYMYALPAPSPEQI